MSSHLPSPPLSLAQAQGVAVAVLQLYDSLPAHGKPSDEEWTVLASIIATIPCGVSDTHSVVSSVNSDHSSFSIKVLALGTGTKCVGDQLKFIDGNILHDSHAEVIARRAFHRYVCEEMEAMCRGAVSPVWQWDALPSLSGSICDDADSHTCTKNNNTNIRRILKLRDGVNLHMYISQSPCGDASIHDTDAENVLTVVQQYEKETGRSSKRQRFDPTARTGARIANSVTQLQMNPNHNNNNSVTINSSLDSVPHSQKLSSPETMRERGVLRTKPGRGEVSLSMSCSDKILRWMFCGLQGGGLASLMKSPLRLSSIIISAPADASVVSMALYERLHPLLTHLSMDIQSPTIHIVPTSFRHRRDRESGGGGVTAAAIVSTLRPSPASINWSATTCSVRNRRKPEVTVGVTGRKFGMTQSTSILKARSSLCRAVMLDTIENIRHQLNGSDNDGDDETRRPCHCQAYRALKTHDDAHWYRTQRDRFLSFFSSWIITRSVCQCQSHVSTIPKSTVTHL